jgi:glycosyltransferase involved in cell wall biosynthesis
VGEGGHESRLKGLARQLCPDEAIRFHGYLHKDELRPVCEACDVFVLLPVDEPFGMVFPEAAANGLLLVGPDHGGPMEILDGGRLGWVCDAFSPEALAERLAEIWALDDATVNQRRQEADRACRARYAPAVVGPQLLHALTHGR